MGNLTQERETGFLLNVSEGKSQSNTHDTQQLDNTQCRVEQKREGKKRNWKILSGKEKRTDRSDMFDLC